MNYKLNEDNNLVRPEFHGSSQKTITDLEDVGAIVVSPLKKKIDADTKISDVKRSKQQTLFKRFRKLHIGLVGCSKVGKTSLVKKLIQGNKETKDG